MPCGVLKLESVIITIGMLAGTARAKKTNTLWYTETFIGLLCVGHSRTMPVEQRPYPSGH
jgi:hypothetical protein